MARFTTRVQLHGVDEGDDAYETLHRQMKKRGFSRTIESDSATYDLPWGSYNYVGERTIDEVHQQAKAAAAASGHDAGIVVTEGTRKWSGLRSA
jgi:hypothetical protein